MIKPVYSAIITAFVLASLPAVAQTIEELQDTCRDGDSYEARITACDALVVSDEVDDKLWPLAWRGDAHKDNDQFAAALPDYDAALGFDPEHQFSLRGRAFALRQLDRHAEALADLTLLTQLDPDSAWVFNFYGIQLQEFDRHQEALQAFDTSVSNDPDYTYPYFNAAESHLALDQVTEAERSLQALAQRKPFERRAHFELGEFYEEQLADMARAGLHYRMAVIIAPNDRVSELRLEDIAALVEEVDLPLAEYIPAQPAQVQYVVAVVPESGMSEMEESIMELQFFFTGSDHPEPEALALLGYEYTQDGDVLRYEGQMVADQGFSDFLAPRPLAQQAGFYRGLMPVWFPEVPDSPERVISFDGAGPADLWPLDAGREVEGSGAVQIVCPEVRSMRAVMFGCVDDVAIGHVADLSYKISVLREERVFVPAGAFDTFVIRYEETRTVTSMGRSVDHQTTGDWWFVPELGFYVKRVQYIDGKTIEYDAVRISR